MHERGLWNINLSLLLEVSEGFQTPREGGRGQIFQLALQVARNHSLKTHVYTQIWSSNLHGPD